MTLRKTYKNIVLMAITTCLLLLAMFLLCEKSYALSYNDIIRGNASKTKIKTVKSSIEYKRQKAKEKIIQLKNQERKEISKLYQSQAKLEDAKRELSRTQQELNKNKQQLDRLQRELNEAKSQYKNSEIQICKRIKQIYKGERLSILHLILASSDVNTLLDRVYYQKRLAMHDAIALNNLRKDAIRLAAIKQKVEKQRNNILVAIDRINAEKRVISNVISNSQDLINRLRTDRLTYEQAERELARQSDRLEAMISGNISEGLSTVSGFIRPISGGITSPFGWRMHPIFRSRSFHSGVDIAGPNHGAIRAANSGKVIYSGWYGGYGKVVIINHGTYKGVPTSTLYAHLSRINAHQGQTVKKGDIIGYEGTTGYSTGPHLHFEVRVKGKPTNPLGYIK